MTRPGHTSSKGPLVGVTHSQEHNSSSKTTDQANQAPLPKNPLPSTNPLMSSCLENGGRLTEEQVILQTQVPGMFTRLTLPPWGMAFNAALMKILCTFSGTIT